jgi:hypothetical protein
MIPGGAVVHYRNDHAYTQRSGLYSVASPGWVCRHFADHQESPANTRAAVIAPDMI